MQNVREKQGEKISLNLVLGLSLRFLVDCQWGSCTSEGGGDCSGEDLFIAFGIWALDSI